MSDPEGAGPEEWFAVLDSRDRSAGPHATRGEGRNECDDAVGRPNGRDLVGDNSYSESGFARDLGRSNWRGCVGDRGSRCTVFR